MVLHTLVVRNYGGKLPMSIKYENLHSFKEKVILLCQSILETRRISHLFSSALFTIPLKSSVGKIDIVAMPLISFNYTRTHIKISYVIVEFIIEMMSQFQD